MKFRLGDGAELYYTIDDFTDPWREAETVVFHHGMAKNHGLWYGWIPTLAAHYRVIRFDARGMGQSTVPEPGYSFTLDAFANDLLQLVDGLGLDKFHLIGETVGGTISMRFATLHQERLLSLTACTSPTNFNDPHHPESADLIEREGVATWVNQSIARRLDPQMVDPAHPVVRFSDDRYPRPRGGRLPTRGPGHRFAALAEGRADPHPDPGCPAPSGRGAGGLPWSRRALPQRPAGVVPRGRGLRAAYPACALRQGMAGLCQGVVHICLRETRWFPIPSR